MSLVAPVEIREQVRRSRDRGNEAATIFVAGGTGFVGKHIVDRLVANGYSVRLLVHRAPNAAPRDGVETICGDITEPASYEAALVGADVVIHAALTSDLSQDLRAATELRERSARAGVRKFVHLSTISIYGCPAEGIVTEETPPRPIDDRYAQTKLGIEEMLREPSAIPEVLVLRLGCVYGPGGGWWTDGLLQLMRRGECIMVDGGSGVANLIHVDDVAAAVLLGLERDGAAFEAFNVTDGMPVRWSECFSGLEAVLGRSATVSMRADEARAYSRNWLRPSTLRRVLRRLRGIRFVHPLDGASIQGFASRAVYSSQKAAAVLGFRPAYDLERGMETVRRAHEVTPS